MTGGAKGRGREARYANSGVCFIHSAIGFDAQIIFVAPCAAAKTCRPVIASPRINLVENDHDVLLTRVPKGRP